MLTSVTKLVASAALVAGALGAAAAPSGAMSQYVRTKTVYPSDCSVTAGAKLDPGRGWAIGAGTSNCSRRHAYTTLKVRLWFWNASARQWQYIPSTDRTTTFTNSYGFGGRELYTAPLCGGPSTWWVTEVDYAISGAGSGTVMNDMQPYQPGPC